MKDDDKADLTINHADGGETRNAFLMQLVAYLTGIAVHASTLPELSALGAVSACMLGLSIRDMNELRERPADYSVYQVAMSADMAEEMHDGWKAAVQQVL